MSKTIRDAYGEALLEFGENDERIVVLDADVSGSTKSAVFGSKIPDRFYNMGIAEANMVGVAAGMAAEGKIPFVNTFAVFLASIGLLGARSFGSYSNLPIKFMGAYGGLSDSYDGPTHHSIEDIAVFRALPNFEIYVASDEWQTKWLVSNAIKRNKPMYIRLSRNAVPAIYNSQTTFMTGKGKVIQDGTDAAVITCGVLVQEAIKAAEVLKQRGFSVRVIDMFNIKPIDSELVLETAAKTNLIVTAEEHNIYGGLGSAVAEVIAGNGIACKQLFVGIEDTHAETGNYAELMSKYKIDSASILSSILKGLGKV